MVVWIMSQSFLIHVHGERLTRIAPHFILTIIPVRVLLTEASEVRSNRQFIFSPAGRLPRDVRAGQVCNKNGDMNLDVQVQIEQAVMVDYHPKAHRIPRVLWEPKQADTPNGDTTDKGQCGSSQVSINKPEDDSWA